MILICGGKPLENLEVTANLRRLGVDCVSRMSIDVSITFRVDHADFASILHVNGHTLATKGSGGLG